MGRRGRCATAGGRRRANPGRAGSPGGHDGRAPGAGDTKRDGVRIDNILLVSGPESDLYEVMDVPHGNVTMMWYDSPTLKLKRRMYV